jgi:hypothetical protein
MTKKEVVVEMKDIENKIQKAFGDKTVAEYILAAVDNTDPDFTEYNLAISVCLTLVNQIVGRVVSDNKEKRNAVVAIIECLQEDF